MRRPRFNRWIKSEAMRLAHTTSFNLRRLTALAQRQRAESDELAAALLLYAHENGHLERLLSYVYDDELRAEYATVEQRLGNRSVERLALRGTPMMSLPQSYRTFLERFEAAYHTPERIADEKQQLWEQTRQAMLRSGLLAAELARALNLDAANLNAYLTRGETHRFTLETARSIATYVSA